MRFDHAFDAGLALGARVIVLHPGVGFALDFAPNAHIITPDYMAFHHWQSAGFYVANQPSGTYDTAIVCVPRAKALAQDLVAQARACAPQVVVDGQKTDGVDSLCKSIRKRGVDVTAITKAHGRLFWFTGGDFTDWADNGRMVDRLHTKAGVFSADKIDRASRLLLDHLPPTLAGDVADFGAGWGYLAKGVLGHAPGVKTLTLVEANKTALDCARQNIDDPRAEFIWGDATKPKGPFDCIVMNPPFHMGRADRPELGQDFIKSAARSLRKTGQLWMVANRHLPYEHTLGENFADFSCIYNDAGFKVFHATRPRAK